MPYEKRANSTPKPLMPAISSANKAAQRAPLTPRLAGVGSPSASPLLRRGTDPIDSDVTPKGVSKDGVATPVKSFLASNITPRSSSRKAKIESSTTPSGTPNATPANSRPTTADAENSSVIPDGPVSPSVPDRSPERPRSFMNGSRGHKPSTSSVHPASPSLQSEPASIGASGASQDSPRFFFASDAHPSAAASRPPLKPSKSSSFFYADGSRESGPLRPPPQTATASAPTSSAGASRPGRFFHASDVHEQQQQQVTSPLTNGSSVGSRPSPRLANFSPNPVARPPSPPKLAQQWVPSQQTASKNSVVGSPRSGPPVTLPYPLPKNAPPVPASTVVRNEALQRRTSHGRSASVGSVDSSSPSVMTGIRNVSRRTDSFSSTASSAFMTHPSIDIPEETEATPSEWSIPSPFAVISPPPSIPVQITSKVESLSPQALSPILAPSSPAKSVSAGGSLSQLNALAEQARRERKVQDLEISNSSLLAINRALEREMRKQSVELRRFRRLSRSGRLSLASGEFGLDLKPRKLRRDITLGNVDEEGMGSSELYLSEEDLDGDESSEEEEYDEEDEDASVNDDEDEPYQSEDARARAAKQRARDEKRLHADLRKHRQLLANSTRMNQSLKRCLGRTETMIEEGRKALAFAVRVSDIQLGGRVLSDHEDEDDANLTSRNEAVLRAPPSGDGEERAERDSGVDFTDEIIAAATKV